MFSRRVHIPGLTVMNNAYFVIINNCIIIFLIFFVYLIFKIFIFLSPLSFLVFLLFLQFFPSVFLLLEIEGGTFNSCFISPPFGCQSPSIVY